MPIINLLGQLFVAKKGKAFTLTEVLIAIGLLALVATSVVVIINPAERMAQARDNARESHLYNIWHAVNRRIYQNQGSWPTDLECAALPQGIINNEPVYALISSSDYNLYQCIHPAYLVNPVVDPGSGYYTDSSNYDSGYQIWQHPDNGRVFLKAPQAELSDSIKVGGQEGV